MEFSQYIKNDEKQVVEQVVEELIKIYRRIDNKLCRQNADFFK